MTKPQMLVMDLMKIHDAAYNAAFWVGRDRATKIEWVDDESWVANILYPLWWLSKGNSREAGIQFPESRFDNKRFQNETEKLYDQFSQHALKLAHSDPRAFVKYLGTLEQQEMQARQSIDRTTKIIHEHSDVVIEKMDQIIRVTRAIKTSCDIVLTVANPAKGASKLALFAVGTGYSLACDFIDHATKNPDKIDLLGFATDQAKEFAKGKVMGATLDCVAGAFKAKFCDEAFKMANQAELKYRHTVNNFLKQGGKKAQSKQITKFIDKDTTEIINGRVTGSQWRIIDRQAKTVQSLLNKGNKNEKIIDQVKDYTNLGIQLLNMAPNINQFAEDVGNTAKDAYHGVMGQKQVQPVH